MARKFRQREDTDKSGGKFYGFLFGALTGIISAICFAGLFALVISKSDLGENAITFASYGAAALGGLICGANCAKKIGSKGLLCGLGAGVIMAVLLFACGIALTGFKGTGGVIMPLVAIAASTVGGVVGVNFKK